MSNLIHYCIVRKDLPIGVIAAQLIHAAGESSPGALPPHTFAVCLAARDEVHLKQLLEKLVSLDVSHKAIYEPDAPWNGQLMAVGITPCLREHAKYVTSGVPLLK